MRCPRCNIVMKDEECIKPWYVFFECQKCGLMINQKTVSPCDMDRFIFMEQEDFKSFKECLAELEK